MTPNPIKQAIHNAIKYPPWHPKSGALGGIIFSFIILILIIIIAKIFLFFN